MVTISWAHSPGGQSQGPGYGLRLWGTSPSHEPAQPVALTLPCRLHWDLQIECQAP